MSSRNVGPPCERAGGPTIRRWNIVPGGALYASLSSLDTFAVCCANDFVLPTRASIARIQFVGISPPGSPFIPSKQFCTLPSGPPWGRPSGLPRAMCLAGGRLNRITLDADIFTGVDMEIVQAVYGLFPSRSVRCYSRKGCFHFFLGVSSQHQCRVCRHKSVSGYCRGRLVLNKSSNFSLLINIILLNRTINPKRYHFILQPFYPLTMDQIMKINF